MPPNFYRSTEDRPVHLSVGAVVVNDKGELLCRHFSIFKNNFLNIYLFTTETPEPGENLDQALSRGILEELGAKAEIIGYIGSITGPMISHDREIEKNVVYFLMRLTEMTDSPIYPDEDGPHTIEWQTPEFLLEKIETYPEEIKHSILNESKIINAAVLYLNKNSNK